MRLTAKPDFAEARNAWNHYWAGAMLKRPLVVAAVPKGDKAVAVRGLRYYHAVTENHEAQLALIDEWLETTLFLAEAIPFFGPDHGPDQMAAFLGAELRFSEGSKHTNWVEPLVDDWEAVLPLELDEHNSVWQSLLTYSRRLAEHARGRYLVGCCDFHSHADTLSALRGSQNLCLDFYDCPELVAQAMQDVRKLYQPIYSALHEAGGMSRETGTIGWIPFWCEGRFATIQCDFICMVSPEFFRRHILPAIEEEAAFLDHCIFHLDGPGALVHLDDILAIKQLDAIQWVSGAGQTPMHEWTEVLKKCQQAGKGLQIYDVNLDIIKTLSRKLKPEGIVYCLNAKTPAEAEEVIRWLEQNT